MRLQVSAFQINDTAILTVKNGEELICSGMYPAKELQPGIMEVDFGPEKFHVSVKETNDDPTIVGAYEGQRRFTWSGEMDAEETKACA